MALAEIVREAQREILPYDKNLFRGGAGLSASLAHLDSLWAALRDGLHGAGNETIAAREAAAIVATARWSYAAALARKESRGMYVREDAPHCELGFSRRLIIGGLREHWTRFDTPVMDEVA